MKSNAGAVVGAVAGVSAVLIGGARGELSGEEIGAIRFDLNQGREIAAALPVLPEIAATDMTASARIAMQDGKVNPVPATAGDEAAKPDALTAAPVFGKPDGGWWLTLAPAVASNLGDETSVGFRAGLATFVADDIQVGGEVGLWEFQQPGDNAFGGSMSFVLRWHFIHEGKWTVYADGGIGLLLASGDVPDGGTNVNFMPRLGVGVTRQITDGGTRLEVGLGWHHISNARINGDDENPSRDLPLLHFGVIIPL